jgi:ketosteroid isomerase-like protein
MRSVLGVVVILVWSAVAQASEADVVTKVVDKQDPFETGASYTDDAVVIPPPGSPLGGVTTPETFSEALVAPSSIVTTSKHKDTKVTLAADGKTAWASFTMKITQNKQTDAWRVSDVLVKTAKGWKVAATAWTLAVSNAAANQAAKDGDASRAAFGDSDVEASLAAAFKKLTTDGLDASAAARKDLVAIGSGPNERTTSGTVLAKAWKAAWQGKTTVTSLAARVTEAGTTGWVAASVDLQKKGYKIPFLVFCVFEKTKDGAWSLVHVHFAV